MTDETPADAIDLLACDGAFRHRLRTPQAADRGAWRRRCHRGAVLRASPAHRFGRRGDGAGGGVGLRHPQTHRSDGRWRNGADRGAGRTRQSHRELPRRTIVRAKTCAAAFSRSMSSPDSASPAIRWLSCSIAAGLNTAAMQTVAREFNLPETVFVFPPGDPGQRARVRIFTPARELPFAGHPTVGTAVLLAHLDGGADARDIVIWRRGRAGRLPCPARRRGRPRQYSSSRSCQSISGRCATRPSLRRRFRCNRPISAAKISCRSHWTAGNPLHLRPGARARCHRAAPGPT